MEEVQLQERLAYYNSLREQERQNIVDLNSGPSIADKAAAEEAVIADKGSNGEVMEVHNRELNEPKISFREVTQVRNFKAIDPCA